MNQVEHLRLLSKRLSGEISPEESATLYVWLQQSPDNEHLAAESQILWDKTLSYGKTFSPNLNADFKKVQARIRDIPQTQLQPSISQRLLRAAAVAALLVAAFWGLKQFTSTANSQLFVSAENTDEKSAVLPDGSHIWLRNGSQLAYPQKFSGRARNVTLHGEAYFDVKHDPAHPFKVLLENGGSVEVLGTQFDVRQTEEQTSVLVRSGKVRFSPTAKTDGALLTASQKAVCGKGTTQILVSNLTSLNELSWQTGGLEFVNTPLQQVLEDLEKYYGVQIVLLNPTVRNCPHSAPLTSQPIDKVLRTLAVTHQLKVKKLGERQYELSGGHCN